jgi:hypothetical protein
MPLSAKAQAERRARLKSFQEPKKISRRRCSNCDKAFPKTRYNRKFCDKKCKREYEQNGGTAFGPLKTRLEKLVRSITDAQYRVLCAANAEMWGRIHALELALSQSPNPPIPGLPANTSQNFPPLLPHGHAR